MESKYLAIAYIMIITSNTLWASEKLNENKMLLYI